MHSVQIEQLRLRRAADFELGPLDLNLAAGSRTAIVGPSGCGKTTLLRCIAGLERPDAGRIRLGDRVASDGGELLVPPADRKIGFVFQDGALWPHMTAAQHLRFVSPGCDAEALLARVGLAHAADRKPRELSGGEGQRLALARALAGDPELLVLDEPLASVDVHLRTELATLVRTLATERGVTLLIVTHDRDEALAMGDDLVVLHHGQVIEQGSAVDLLREPRTVFTASFLCRAARLNTTVEGDHVVSPFGRHDAATSDEMVLVVLPGDVAIASEGDGPQGEVLNVRPSFGNGLVATVRIDGDDHAFEVICKDDVTPGDRVPLRLARPARLLPRPTGREDEQR